MHHIAEHKYFQLQIKKINKKIRKLRNKTSHDTNIQYNITLHILKQSKNLRRHILSRTQCNAIIQINYT
jgi:hypothetical protein